MKNPNLHSFGKIHAEGIFNDNNKVRKIIFDLAKKYQFTILDSCEHPFEPYGFTLVILLAESHISIHTFPENNNAYVDCFTCGHQDPVQFLKDLATEFGGKLTDQQYVDRH